LNVRKELPYEKMDITYRFVYQLSGR